jgi:hypothetical protein
MVALNTSLNKFASSTLKINSRWHLPHPSGLCYTWPRLATWIMFYVADCGHVDHNPRGECATWSHTMWLNRQPCEKYT